LNAKLRGTRGRAGRDRHRGARIARSHGVQELGTVSAGLPTWRLHWLNGHEWAIVCTTALTLVIVILSQSGRDLSHVGGQLGIADDLSRDFVGIGLANVACGLVGAFPVNASPARTTVTGWRRADQARPARRGSGGIGVVALRQVRPHIPLAALAGVLLFIGGRLIKSESSVGFCSRVAGSSPSRIIPRWASS